MLEQVAHLHVGVGLDDLLLGCCGCSRVDQSGSRRINLQTPSCLNPFLQVRRPRGVCLAACLTVAASERPYS